MSARPASSAPSAERRQQRGDHALGAEHVDLEHPPPVVDVAVLDGCRARSAPPALLTSACSAAVSAHAGRRARRRPPARQVGDEPRRRRSPRRAPRAAPPGGRPPRRPSRGAERRTVASPIPELAPVTTTRSSSCLHASHRPRRYAVCPRAGACRRGR